MEFKLECEEITGLKHVCLVVVGLAAYEYGEGQEEGRGGGVRWRKEAEDEEGFLSKTDDCKVFVWLFVNCLPIRDVSYGVVVPETALARESIVRGSRPMKFVI